jgi:hypothetical protein
MEVQQGGRMEEEGIETGGMGAHRKDGSEGMGGVARREDGGGRDRDGRDRE